VEREMRGGGGLIQFPTKGDTKSNSILKKRKSKVRLYSNLYQDLFNKECKQNEERGMRVGGGLTLQEL
jgi:hypothetical protein